VVKFRCATRLIVFNEAHLLRILSKYARYYNEYAPCTRPIARFRDIIGQPNFGGLHHRYARMSSRGAKGLRLPRTTGYLACKISARIPQSEKPADYQ